MILYLALSYGVLLTLLIIYIVDLWVDGGYTTGQSARRTLLAILAIITAPLTMPIVMVGGLIWLILQACRR